MRRAVLVLALALTAAPAAEGRIRLTQLGGAAGCFSALAAERCAPGPALYGPDSVVVSPDGRHVYAVARDPDHLLEVGSSSLTAFARDARSGALRRLECLSDDAGDGREGTDGTCRDADALQSANDIAISPDGRSLYVTSDLGALAIFSRDGASGRLTQAGCVKEHAPDSRCIDAYAMERPVSVAVSPDGAHVYVTSRQTNSVVTFARDAATGMVRELGCVSDSGLDGLCRDGDALVSPTSIAVSPDGRHAYVTTAKEQNGLVAFTRDSATGLLAPRACFISSGDRRGRCRRTPGLLDAAAVAVSPDGANVYVSSIDSDALATFARDGTTGDLDPVDCIAGESGYDERACRNGIGLSYAADVAVTHDGRAVVVVGAGDDAVAVYRRDRRSGRLQRAGCLMWRGEDDRCGRARALFGPKGLALSPRSDSLYVTSDTGHAVAAFRLRLGR